MKNHSLNRRQLLAAACAMPVSIAFGQSSSYPNRPVRIIFPFPPGTANDVAIRLVAERLSAKWGQPVVVESRPGGSTIIGTDLVARAPADGYTLLANITAILQNTALGRKLPYNFQRDLKPVAQVHRSQLGVLARSTLPGRNLSEMIALARRSGQRLNFASWGLGSTAHIVLEKMKRDHNIEVTHVPYKGGAEIISALLSGDVDFGMSDLLSPAGHIKSGKLKVIGITGARRRAEYPQAPTLAEAGVSGFEGYNWLGMFAPSQVDPAIVEKINLAVNEAVSEPAVAQRFARDLIVEPVRASVQEWTQTVERDLTSWRAVIQLSRFSID